MTKPTCSTEQLHSQFVQAPILKGSWPWLRNIFQSQKKTIRITTLSKSLCHFKRNPPSHWSCQRHHIYAPSPLQYNHVFLLVYFFVRLFFLRNLPLGDRWKLMKCSSVPYQSALCKEKHSSTMSNDPELLTISHFCPFSWSAITRLKERFRQCKRWKKCYGQDHCYIWRGTHKP